MSSARVRQAPTAAPSNGARPPVEDRLDHEELVVRRGARTGLYVIVAVHSTALGPALGGARLWSYRTPGDAIADALRLSEAMTYKAAVAGLDLGGGKSVLCVEQGLSISRRQDLMRDLGDVVESLEGRYIVAEDVGTNADDMTVIAGRTSHVVGLPVKRGGSGDPSPVTARGVEAAMRATCERGFGSPELDRVRVCVIGLGHVGTSLAERLADAGCRLLVSDVNPAKRGLAGRLGAEWADPGDAAIAECDVLAPCALGGTITRSNLAELRCGAICGSANNVLADDSVAAGLHRRGILYAPDFIANAGGLISVYGELHGLRESRVRELVEGIGSALEAVFAEAESRGVTPLAAAHELATARLERARGPAEPARLGA